MRPYRIRAHDHRTRIISTAASLLRNRQRACGKTTALRMLALAATGLTPSAAAWAKDEDERRKALLAYLLEGPATIVWDNIERGAALTSKCIEDSCTSETHTDRVLGLSKPATAPTYTVQASRGNNIRPRGDLASRSLQARLTVDRPDPQNRTFAHPHPITWTRDHRGEILRALYTILLGNPQLDPDCAAECQTRFKVWWHLVGSAVEYASDQYKAVKQLGGQPLRFAKLLYASEEGDEEAASVGEILTILRGHWRDEEFTAADVLELLAHPGTEDVEAIETLRQFCIPRTKGATCTSKSIGHALAKFVDLPERTATAVLTLKRGIEHRQNIYKVKRAELPLM